jgi:hypothetical protein
MSTKHTPGPWLIHKFNRSNKPESVRQEIATVNDGTPICSLTGNEANANLIAAAPELLVALKIAHAALTDGDHRSDGDIRLARRAIAKAEGGGK